LEREKEPWTGTRFLEGWFSIRGFSLANRLGSGILKTAMDEPLPESSGLAKQAGEPITGGARIRVVETASPSVPDHELLRRIGSGAYGEVWLARNLATGALRAVKVVYRSTFADERPFNREFEGIKKFDAVSRSHPSQLALFHVGETTRLATSTT